MHSICARGALSGNPGNPRFYQTTLNLSALLGTTNKPLVSLTFDKPAAILLDRCMVEFSEAATEGNQIFIGQVLPSNQQDLMVETCR